MATSTSVVDDYFQKEIVLKSGHCHLYTLLTLESQSIFTTHPWSIQSFSTLEKQLNDIKSRLNDYDIRTWQQHTSYTNLAYDIVAQLKQVCNPELCTQAWAKFYEIIHRCQLEKCFNLPHCSHHTEFSQHPIATLHLCEGPGAFITGLNHYLKSYYPQLPWQWLATTLNPYYEGNRDGNIIADDRFICKTLSHWNFGRDDSGNILRHHNMTYLIESLTQWPPIRLITADGSIDCSDQPARQESIVTPIHYCETLTALRLLAKDGIYVMKMFTSFQHSSICLIYLLLNVFQEVKAVKPVCSKSGNSEVYIICNGYIGFDAIPKPFWDKLNTNYGLEDTSTALFPLEFIPQPVIDKIYSFSQYFATLQMDAIRRNIKLFHNLPRSKRKFISKAKKMIAKEYITRYHVQEIQPMQRIVTHADVNIYRTNSKFKSTGLKFGSYNQRISQTKRKWSEAVDNYSELIQIAPEQCCNRFTGNEILREEISNSHWLYVRKGDRNDFVIETGKWTITYGFYPAEMWNSCFASNDLIFDVYSARQEQSEYKKVKGNTQDYQLSLYFYSNSCCESIEGILSLIEMDSQSTCVIVSNEAEQILSTIYKQCEVTEQQVAVVTSNTKSKLRVEHFIVSSMFEYMNSSNACEKFILGCLEKVDIIFADFYPRLEDQRITQTVINKLILTEVLLTCQVLTVNGQLVLTVGDLLNRFQVSIVYALHLIFKKVTVLHSVNEKICSKVIVCCGFHKSAGLNQYLQKTLNMISLSPDDQTSSNELDCLCFIPIDLLTCEGSEFYKYIYEVNNRSLWYELVFRANKEA